jgi:D-amino-acid dehydrogenase
MYDAIVIGGGIAGMSVAYHLVSAGAHTLLIDRADAGQATAAGAGVISPETSNNTSDDWYQFAVKARDYYPALIDELQAEGAGDTGYHALPIVLLAVSEDEDTPFATMRNRIVTRVNNLGGAAPGDLVMLDGATANARYPMLAPVRDALYYDVAARVDGRLMTRALRRVAVKRGLEIRQASVERLVLRDRAVSGVVVDGESISSGAVVLAGGSWAGEFSEQLGVTLPIDPQRGEIIHLSLPGAGTESWPMLRAMHNHYIVPWTDDRLVVGATRVHRGFTPHMTVAGVEEVLSEAVRVVPGLVDARIEDIRVGLRPSTPDNNPILGTVPDIRNVYLMVGHGPTGLQVGPYSGKLITELVRGQAVGSELDPFSITRFL